MATTMEATPTTTLLDMMDSMVATLQSKQLDLEALGCLEQGLFLKRRMLGAEHDDVCKMFQDVVLLYNKHAMEQLGAGAHELCLELLRKADALTKPGKFASPESLRILTYNNFGCYYRRLHKLKTALKFLSEAASLGATTPSVRNLSVTHLNLCAIQSQLGRHDVALEHAQSAIFHAQEELVTSDAGSDVLDAQSREEKIVALAIAYHNLAVELEFNARGDASLQWYKKALQMVFKYKDTNGNLWKTFKASFDAAKKKHATATLPVENAKQAPPRSHRRHVAPAADATHSYKPTQPSKATRPTTASRKRPPPDTAGRRWHDRAPSPPKQPTFAAFLKAKGPTAEAAFKVAPPDRQSPPPPYSRRPTSAHIQGAFAPCPTSALRVPAQQTTITTNLFDSDSDEEIVEVFEASSPAVRMERVDVRRPQARATLAHQTELSNTTGLPERVSHIEYLKRLRQSVETGTANNVDARPHEIAKQHRLQLEMHRIHDSAARKLQAHYRGYRVRRRLPRAWAAWGAPSPSRVERYRLHCVLVIQSIVRMHLVRRWFVAYRRQMREAQMREAQQLEATRRELAIRAQERRLLDEAKRELAAREAETRDLLAHQEAARAKAEAALRDAEAKQAAAQAEAAAFKQRLAQMEAQTKQLLALNDVEKARALRALQEAEKVKALLAQREAKAKALIAEEEMAKADAAQASATAARVAWEAQYAETQRWIDAEKASAAAAVDTPEMPALPLPAASVDSSELPREPSVAKVASARREHALEFAQQLEVHISRDDLLAAQQREAKHLAASVIQGVVKGRSVRRKRVLPRAKQLAAQQREAQHVAASVLTALCKGMAVRQRALHAYARHLSTLVISRCHTQRELTSAMQLEDYACAATTLQRVLRGFWCRRHIATSRYMWSCAAARIQAIVRGRQCRLLCTALRAGYDGASRKIQRLFRRHQSRRQHSGTRYIHTMAAHVVQQAWRRYLAKIEAMDAMSRRIEGGERNMASRLAQAVSDALSQSYKQQLSLVAADAVDMAARLAEATTVALGATVRAQTETVLRVEMSMAGDLSSGVVDWLHRRRLDDAERSTLLEEDMASRLAHAFLEKTHARVYGEWHTTACMSERLTDACLDHLYAHVMTSRTALLADEADMASRLATASVTCLMDRITQARDTANAAIQEIAATSIQARVRGCLVRQQIVLPKLREDDVNVLVQAVVTDRAATTIQALSRGVAVRKQRLVNARHAMAETLRHVDAAVHQLAASVIQALGRGYLVRKFLPTSISRSTVACINDCPQAVMTAEANQVAPINTTVAASCGDLPAGPNVMVAGTAPNSVSGEAATNVDAISATGSVSQDDEDEREGTFAAPITTVATLDARIATHNLLPQHSMVLAAAARGIGTALSRLHDASKDEHLQVALECLSTTNANVVDQCVADAQAAWLASTAGLGLHAALQVQLATFFESHGRDGAEAVIQLLAAAAVNAVQRHASQDSAVVLCCAAETAVRASIETALSTHAAAYSVRSIAATSIQAVVRGCAVRRRRLHQQLSVKGFVTRHIAREVAAIEALALVASSADNSVHHIAASVLQTAYREYVRRRAASHTSSILKQTSGASLNAPRRENDVHANDAPPLKTPVSEAIMRTPQEETEARLPSAVPTIASDEPSSAPSHVGETMPPDLFDVEFTPRDEPPGSDDDDAVVPHKSTTTNNPLSREPDVAISHERRDDVVGSDTASSHLSLQYSQSSFTSDIPMSKSRSNHPSAESLASQKHISSSSSIPASFASSEVPYSSSQASFVSDMLEEDLTLAPPKVLLAQLPSLLRTAYDKTLAAAVPRLRVDPYEVLGRNLPFDDYVESLSTAYDDVGVLAAADALRALTHVDAALKTQANFESLVAALSRKAVDDIDVWTEDVEAACMWLLHEYVAS
ncbi:hypothetical protein SPRG_09915 [Saprolegnia parasitica CBS 223.65]|uniref:Uncharacterized protein n=1 Tax=Saprolegnia parasitica (strain CBS 223.65) TaxID=695850 RepID=A0A067C195_SAPPC|nr:hypothetical protein SPRG_09915 [Saprolegnia parasitica CBS 223.65]KDO24278.1 hypothetical protein SPRG_09915 [Saprolegnia parasitica CBS 223.65]|eukprot:XP_012205049.1 hypothetical protein SPRG_09915 [Saprolegnia parasitica CBS 223.65]